MKSKIKIITTSYYATVETDDDDNICSAPEELEWAIGMLASELYTELGNKKCLIKWDESFYE